VLEREPTSTTESLTIQVVGENHRGQRVALMVSDTEVRQKIRYQSLRRVDPEVDASRDADFMRAIANEILWRLVAQWKAGGAREPEKVESRPKRRRRRET
jgi:hypothetical protein